MYELYQQGFSLAQVAEAFGVTRQGVFKMFTRREYDLRSPSQPLPFRMFNGRKYTLRVNGYYGATEGDRGYLHRAMWEDAYGPIPTGFDIHHRDHDRTNNVLSNFECLPKDEHARRYSTGNNQYASGRPHRVMHSEVETACAGTEAKDSLGT